MYQKFITVNQTVPNLHLLHSAPSGIESTSLVLSAGLDLHFNRVTPSEGFDLLSSDFNRPLLTLILLLLTVATVVLRYFARKKTLAQGWA